MDKSMKKLMEMLKEYLDYRDGALYWVKSKKGVLVGNRFGCKNAQGYRLGSFFGNLYYEHRLIWLYHNGVLPKEIDHINGVSDDNRIENLRKCSSRENKRNRLSVVNTTSRYKGVTWYKRDKKWKAQIGLGDRNLHLGYFDNEGDAAKAYNTAAKTHFGEFANVNSIG